MQCLKIKSRKIDYGYQNKIKLISSNVVQHSRMALVYSNIHIL